VLSCPNESGQSDPVPFQCAYPGAKLALDVVGVVVVASVVMVPGGGERRGGKNHQQQDGGKNLFHATTVARVGRWEKSQSAFALFAESPQSHQRAPRIRRKL
jgi:hypothetical protein